MNCKICGNKSSKVFTAKILNKYDSDFYSCSVCNFLFAADPFWLKEAYQSAINISDTGILQRNINFSKIVSIILFFFYDRNGKCLDYAGGYGIFTRLMRDIGFNFFWDDPYSENLLAKGFDYNPLEQKDIELTTAFEVLEHLENPLNELEKILNFSDNIIFSTELLPEIVPSQDWWYYGFEHGQHISFYSEKTLLFLSNKFQMSYYRYQNLHIFTKKKINEILLKILLNLSPILYEFVKRNLKSKTLIDSQYLINK